jgi:hypothetical protein
LTYTPNKVVIVNGTEISYNIDDYISNRFVAFTYPGKFAGCGLTQYEALQMSSLRFESGKRKYFEKHIDATESDWANFAADRESKMEKIYISHGLDKESTWNSDNFLRSSVK